LVNQDFKQVVLTLEEFFSKDNQNHNQNPLLNFEACINFLECERNLKIIITEDKGNHPNFSKITLLHLTLRNMK